MQRDELLVPPLTLSDCPEEQIGNKEEDASAQADNPGIGECRVSREFGPSILSREGADNFQAQRFGVLPIAHQDHAISLLICEEKGYESGIHSGVRKIPIGTISRDRKAEGVES
jgi:hypothetical protein